MEFDTNPRIIGSLDDSRETAQAVYDALNSRHFGSFCNAVFFITQFTSKPRAYSLNGKEITGYEIKGKNLGLMIRNSILRFHSLITGRQFEENWNYKLRFPVGGRVEVEIHETLCKSKKCNRTYTNSTLEAHGVDYFDLVMMDYSK